MPNSYDDSSNAPKLVGFPEHAWKAKAVTTCMVDAFGTLRCITGGGGPKQPGSGWPAILAI
ncbi:hypothetical protein [Labrys neptuniae]